jgi:hypothetical protein
MHLESSGVHVYLDNEYEKEERLAARLLLIPTSIEGVGRCRLISCYYCMPPAKHFFHTLLLLLCTPYVLCMVNHNHFRGSPCENMQRATKTMYMKARLYLQRGATDVPPSQSISKRYREVLVVALVVVPFRPVRIACAHDLGRIEAYM